MERIAFLARTFLGCVALLCAIAQAAFAQTIDIDEEELASRFYTDLAISWSWALDCSESSNKHSSQSCYFKAYPDPGDWIAQDGTQVGSAIDKRFKENFDKIVAIYQRLLQDKQTFRRPPKFVLEINSAGGGVAFAVAVGRSIRSLGGEVRVGKSARCFSSCVFILMGGETRWIKGQVGIHRPFFEVPNKTLSQSTIQRAIDNLSSSLREYAQEVNVSPRLIDDMLATPPERMRLLTTEELDAYGLVLLDPVAAEAQSLEEARAWRLTRREYMTRKERVRSLCGWPRDDRCYRDVMAGRR